MPSCVALPPVPQIYGQHGGGLIDAPKRRLLGFTLYNLLRGARGMGHGARLGSTRTRLTVSSRVVRYCVQPVYLVS